jgi:hypothetical protein
MTAESTLVYVKIVMYQDMGYPKPRDTHLGPQAVSICDGVGVHIGINVLKECIRMGIEVVLRVPNPSCKLQGEDLINFLILKVCE